MSLKKALVFLASGAEEIEAVVAIDVLRRAKVEVTAVGLESNDLVTCSRDVIIKPDASLKEALTKGPYDVIVLPGGLQGAENLGKSSEVGSLLKDQEKSGRLIGAICAAPAISLMAHGIGEGKSITCYPSFEKQVSASGKYTYKEQEVVVDGNLITSQGPGTAFKFALALVEQMLGKEQSDATAKPMLL